MDIQFNDLGEAPITVTLPASLWLAAGAALRLVDDDLLTDLGVLPGVLPNVQPAFDALDTELVRHFGDDWDLLVTEDWRVEQDLEDATAEDEDPDGDVDDEECW